MTKTHSTQNGFTLIELIVVIVILGILAATALPKFADLGADARIATMKAAQGSLAATNAMAHGKYLVNTTGTPLVSTIFEGTTVTYSVAFASGYPTANLNTALAAGLSANDFTTAVTVVSVAGTAGVMTVTPKSAATPATCQLTYTEPTSATAAPTITIASGGC